MDNNVEIGGRLESLYLHINICTGPTTFSRCKMIVAFPGQGRRNRGGGARRAVPPNNLHKYAPHYKGLSF